MIEENDYPFGHEAGPDIITQPVPLHLRAPIVRLATERETRNRFPQPASMGLCGNWYRASKPISEALEEIEDELRRLVEAPRKSCIEYYAGWRYRCVDQNTLRAEYLSGSGK